MEKKKYEVYIEETLRKTIVVEAENEDEAFQIADELYHEEDVVLTADDFAEYNIYVEREVK
jgi:hypothetical protein